MLEAVVCTPRDAEIAEQAGATQLELCVAIELGGLTPSAGLVRATRKRCSLPIFAMLRPRPGGFAYDASEGEAMREDASALMEAGADGLVFGVVRDGQFDLEAMAAIRAEMGEGQAVCHRAFDRLADLEAGLEQLVALGFQRVLTSGGTASALEGAQRLAALERQAAGRIEILPGGGVRAHNAAEVVQVTGLRRLHLAPFVPKREDSEARESDAEAIRAVRTILDLLERTENPNQS